VALGANRGDADARRRIEAAGGRALPLVGNLADLDLKGTHVAAIEAEFGPVDILVNNTGGRPPPASG
jgi:3-oxoacyl-[acyl-carrier protein] reductase